MPKLRKGAGDVSNQSQTRNLYRLIGIGALIVSLILPTTAAQVSDSVTVPVDTSSVPDPPDDPNFKVRTTRRCTGNPATVTGWDTRAPISANDASASSEVGLLYEQQRDGSWELVSARFSITSAGFDHMEITYGSFGWDATWTWAGIPLNDGQIALAWECEWHSVTPDTEKEDTGEVSWVSIDGSASDPVSVDSDGTLCSPLRNCFG